MYSKKKLFVVANQKAEKAIWESLKLFFVKEIQVLVVFVSGYLQVKLFQAFVTLE